MDLNAPHLHVTFHRSFLPFFEIRLNPACCFSKNHFLFCICIFQIIPWKYFPFTVYSSISFNIIFKMMFVHHFKLKNPLPPLLKRQLSAHCTARYFRPTAFFAGPLQYDLTPRSFSVILPPVSFFLHIPLHFFIVSLQILPHHNLHFSNDLILYRQPALHEIVKQHFYRLISLSVRFLTDD